eukprot:c47297_g1_i1 orf=1-303(-)
MALNHSAQSERSSYISDRSWHWNSLHSWSIFNSRPRSRVPAESPPSRSYRSRPLRTSLGDDVVFQRHAQGRTSEVSDPSFMGFHTRSGPTQVNHQHQHQHQ